ncbi:MAG: hypothetical protein WC428_06945 [Candidatus Paceibacterota bacterium]
MTVKVEVVARLNDPEKIEAMKRNPRDCSLRETKSGVAVYLPLKNGICYNVPSLLYDEEFRMNISEGRSNDGMVTVVCSIDGKPFRPFWVRGRKNQREDDKEVDARFSLYGSVCVITLNRLGLFIIQKLWVEKKYGRAEVRTKEFFSTVLKRNGGKFIFSEGMFGTKSFLGYFEKATKAAIRKANSFDGGGPMFFLEKDPVVVFHDEMPAGMSLDNRKPGKTVISGGMTVRVNSET